jgi:hypothetical protein
MFLLTANFADLSVDSSLVVVGCCRLRARNGMGKFLRTQLGLRKGDAKEGMHGGRLAACWKGTWPFEPHRPRSRDRGGETHRDPYEYLLAVPI